MKWDNVRPIKVDDLLNAELTIELAKRFIRQSEVRDFCDSDGLRLEDCQGFKNLKEALGV